MGEFAGGHSAQFIERGRSAAQPDGVSDLDAERDGLRPRELGQAIGALGDGFVEQPARERRCYQCQHALRASRLAEDGHVVRVAAEYRDVLLHPSQRGDLVEQAKVHRAVWPFSFQRWMREEAELAEAIVEAHDHRAFLRQRHAAVGRQR